MTLSDSSAFFQAIPMGLLVVLGILVGGCWKLAVEAAV